MVVRRTAPPTPVASSPARRQARLPGILLAVLLVLFGGSAAVAHQPDAHGGIQTVGQSPGQTVGPSLGSLSAHHQDPPQHLQGAIAHPAHAATQAPLPLLPAVEQHGETALRASVPPERPQLTAAHLAHQSPRHGRAPPPRTGT